MSTLIKTKKRLKRLKVRSNEVFHLVRSSQSPPLFEGRLDRSTNRSRTGWRTWGGQILRMWIGDEARLIGVTGIFGRSKFSVMPAPPVTCMAPGEGAMTAWWWPSCVFSAQNWASLLVGCSSSVSFLFLSAPCFFSSVPCSPSSVPYFPSSLPFFVIKYDHFLFVAFLTDVDGCIILFFYRCLVRILPSDVRKGRYLENPPWIF